MKGFLNCLILALLLLIVSCKREKEIAEKPNTLPNILFILADDQRYNTIAALGNNEIITPNLDILVKNGLSFSNTYLMGSQNGAVCSPSRAMIMTGRSLFNIDPTGNSIDSSHITLPKALSSGGYHTFHIGKWHNGKDAFINSFDDGSKIFFGGMHSQYFVPTFEFNREHKYSKENLNKPSSKHSSELYADAAVDFLGNYQESNPFFLYVALQAPHDPREMPEKYLKMYDTTAIALPPNFKTKHPFDNGELDIRDEWLAGYPREKNEVKENIRAYYAMITHLDEQIGRILKKLEESGKLDETIIVFSADNGIAIGQHGLMGKQNLYEHSIKVPLIVSGPGIAKNKRSTAMNYLFDLYPTICDLAGIPIPNSVMGNSLTPILFNNNVKIIEKPMLFAYKNFQRAVRDGDWKMIKYNVDNKVRTQLFNLSEDPWEIDDLSQLSEYEDQLKKMENTMRKTLKSFNDPVDLDVPGWNAPVIPQWKDVVSKEELDMLRNLALKERQMRGYGNVK